LFDRLFVLGIIAAIRSKRSSERIINGRRRRRGQRREEGISSAVAGGRKGPSRQEMRGVFYPCCCGVCGVTCFSSFFGIGSFA
jgi:hypothetical protein